MKTCSKCAVEQPLSNFYKSKLGKGGLQSRCKSCIGATHRDWRKKNLDRRAQYISQWRKESGGEYIKSIRQWEKNNPAKRRAHTIVKSAKKRGLLIPKPCEKCGEHKVEAHHDDYNKPLEVRWLCKRCHWALHSKLEIGDALIEKSF